MINQKNINLDWPKKLAEFLDSKYIGPFGIRFGYDALLGLIPGLGDIITTSLSFLIVGHAIFVGASPSVIIRMLINLLIDNLLAKIPLLGLGIDFFWRANLRNTSLLHDYSQNPTQADHVSLIYIIFWLTLSIVFMFSLIILSVYLLSLTWNALFS